MLTYIMLTYGNEMTINTCWFVCLTCIAATGAHAAWQYGPLIRTGIIKLHRRQVTGAVITPDNIQQIADCTHSYREKSDIGSRWLSTVPAVHHHRHFHRHFPTNKSKYYSHEKHRICYEAINVVYVRVCTLDVGCFALLFPLNVLNEVLHFT